MASNLEYIIHVLSVAMHILLYMSGRGQEVPTYTFVAVPSIGLTRHCASDNK